MPGRGLREARACPFPAPWQTPVPMNEGRNFCLGSMSQLSGCHRAAKDISHPSLLWFAQELVPDWELGRSS